MENTPYLYDTLLRVLGQHANWLDLRHCKTLAWMMVGLINSKTVSLGSWTPFVVTQAQYAQSIVRRFRRWLDNNRIKPEPLYGPLIEQALVSWVGKRMYVALDTSMLWNTYCLIRLSVIYRGRAVPLVWRVIEHGSAAVSFATYQALLDEAKSRLPFACQISNSSPPVLIVTMIPFGCMAPRPEGRRIFPDVYRVIAQRFGAFSPSTLPVYHSLSSLHL